MYSFINMYIVYHKNCYGTRFKIESGPVSSTPSTFVYVSGTLPTMMVCESGTVVLTVKRSDPTGSSNFTSTSAIKLSGQRLPREQDVDIHDHLQYDLVFGLVDSGGME